MQEVKCEWSHLSAGSSSKCACSFNNLQRKKKKLQRKCFRAVRYARINVSQGYTHWESVLSHGFVFYAFRFLVFFLLLAHLDHGLISFYWQFISSRDNICRCRCVCIYILLYNLISSTTLIVGVQFKLELGISAIFISSARWIWFPSVIIAIRLLYTDMLYTIYHMYTHVYTDAIRRLLLIISATLSFKLKDGFVFFSSLFSTRVAGA